MLSLLASTLRSQDRSACDYQSALRRFVTAAYQEAMKKCNLIFRQESSTTSCEKQNSQDARHYLPRTTTSDTWSWATNSFHTTPRGKTTLDARNQPISEPHSSYSSDIKGAVIVILVSIPVKKLHHSEKATNNWTGRADFTCPN